MNFDFTEDQYVIKRTAHELLGFVTWGALGASMVVELIP